MDAREEVLKCTRGDTPYLACFGRHAECGEYLDADPMLGKSAMPCSSM